MLRYIVMSNARENTAEGFSPLQRLPSSRRMELFQLLDRLFSQGSTAIFHPGISLSFAVRPREPLGRNPRLRACGAAASALPERRRSSVGAHPSSQFARTCCPEFLSRAAALASLRSTRSASDRHHETHLGRG